MVVIHVVAARRVRGTEALRPRAAHDDVRSVVRVIVGADDPLGRVRRHVVRAVRRDASRPRTRRLGLIETSGLFLRGNVGPFSQPRPARNPVLRLVVARAGLMLVSVREPLALRSGTSVKPFALGAETLSVLGAPRRGLGGADHEQRLLTLAIRRFEPIDADLPGEHHVGGTRTARWLGAGQGRGRRRRGRFRGGRCDRGRRHRRRAGHW